MAAQATTGAVDLAAEKGVDLEQIEGTGADGKVTKGDVESFLSNAGDGDALPDVAASEKETQRQQTAAAAAEARASTGGLQRAVIHNGVEYPEGTDVKDLGKLPSETRERLERIGALPE
jgi:pyruvate/2-oxoglutarate dehydrogenase complex dihydrolipoamide acyltransferase (E2) component